MTPSRPVRVASVPHGHVYVRHLSSPDGDDGVVRLPDPRPERPARGAPWWPAVMLDPNWLTAHAEDYDLLHVHFGFDHLSPPELGAITAALADLGKPYVHTVHDLRNPHHEDRAAHDAALDVLVPAADALLTLTPGAAEEIERRWGRSARVVPHPHVVPLELLSRPRPARPGARPRVGVHLKSLRANLDPLPVLEVLVAEVGPAGYDLVVDVHTDVVVPGAANHHPGVVALLADLERRGTTVHVHDYYDDEQLWEYFLGLDLSVLAYRFGTHSGWLEACHDLGTRVLAPRLGSYHEQRPGVLGYRLAADGRPDREDIRAALAAARDPAPWRADADARLRERRELARVHAETYLSVLGRTAVRR